MDALQFVSTKWDEQVGIIIVISINNNVVTFLMDRSHERFR